MQDRAPGEGRAAAYEGHQSHADGHQQQAQANQERLSKFFYGPPNRSALNHRADDTAISEQIADALDVAPALQIEVKVLADQQAERRFKAGETECCQKEKADQQTDFWLLQGMQPLTET